MAGPGLANGLDPWAEPPDPRERRAWRGEGARAWLGLMALALAFGLIADPAFSMPLVCLLCGWEDARVGRWLKRSDPDRPRGRACSRFYLASGLWKVTLMAGALMFMIIGLLESIQGRPKDRNHESQPSAAFVGCTITSLVSLPLASAVSVFAGLSALRHRTRVWVGPEAHWARADGVWPPHLARRRGNSTNLAKLILLIAMITSSLMMLTVTVIPISCLIPSEAQSSPVHVAIVMTLFIGVPVLILRLRDRLTARMIAPTPSACWSLDVNNDRRTA